MLKKYQFIGFVFLLIIAWICINVSINLIASSVAFDISSDQKYSLTEKTRKWLKQNSDNIYIRLYVGGMSKYPQLKKYATDVMLLLEQYQLASNRKISIKTVEVKPFTASEISAQKAGITGGNGKPWLGIAISDENGNFVNIPFLDPDKQTYIEHDITRALSKLNNNSKPTIGIMSSEINVISSANSLDYTVDWPFVKKLKQEYKVKKISNKAPIIDDEIDVLMIINPKLLKKMTLYAIDQYLVRGGKIILFMDPLSEIAQKTNQNNILQASSGLEVWLFKMGVFYPFDMILGSIDNASELNTSDDKIIKYPFWLEVQKDDFRHPLLNGIKKLRFNYAAPLKLINRENIKQQVLISAGKNTGEQKVDYLARATIADSIKSFNSDDAERLLAVLLEGKFDSLFTEPYLHKEYYLTGPYAYKFLAEKEGKVIVVADSDFLNDKFWQSNVEERSHNFDFLERMVDYLSQKGLVSVEEKNSNIKKSTIYNKLYTLAENHYITKRNLIEKEMLSVIAEQSDMYEKIKRQELITSVVVANKLEELENSKHRLRQQIEEIDYKINNLYQIYFVVLLVINVLLPIIILLVAMIIIRKISLRLSGLAERIADGC